MRPVKFENLLETLKRNKNIVLLAWGMLLMAGIGLAACPLGTNVSNSSCTICIDFNANPTTIYQGQSTTLTLSVSDTLNQASCNYPIGSFSASPSSTYTYTAICSGSGGTVSHSATVTVIPLPTVDIKANGSDGPISIAYNTSATLSWTSTNATACTASGGWSGSKPTSGSESTGNLTNPKTYTLTCTSPGGSASDSVTVNVANAPPSATNLNVTQPDYCLVGWASAIFSWTFTDPDNDTQSAYQIQADNNSNFSSPEVDSGKVVSTSNSYATQAGKLSFNTTYYWRLMVWDSKDLSSSWISGPSFATPRHAYPYVDFTWIPQNPTIDESTQFTDQSQVYGGSVKSSWSWTFQSGSPPTSALQNPLIKFLSTGAKSITLKVTDSDGFNCTGQKTLNTLLKLPDWKEIPPF